jgi:hypothetical protein
MLSYNKAASVQHIQRMLSASKKSPENQNNMRFWSVWYEDDIIAEDFLEKTILPFFYKHDYNRVRLNNEQETWKDIGETLSYESMLFPELKVFTMWLEGKKVPDVYWDAILKWKSSDSRNSLILMHKYPESTQWFMGNKWYEDLSELGILSHVDRVSIPFWRQWVREQAVEEGTPLDKEAIDPLVFMSNQNSNIMRNSIRVLAEYKNKQGHISKDNVEDLMESEHIITMESMMKAVLSGGEKLDSLVIEIKESKTLTPIRCAEMTGRVALLAQICPIKMESLNKTFLHANSIPESLLPLFLSKRSEEQWMSINRDMVNIKEWAISEPYPVFWEMWYATVKHWNKDT